jgi:hypothetical protein
VWVFSKDGAHVKRKSPEKLFAAGQPYTLRSPDGSRDLRIEQGLATIEDKFVRIRRSKIDKQHKISIEEKVWIVMFVAAMRARTKPALKQISAQYGFLLERGQAIQTALDEASPEHRAEMVKALSSPFPSAGPSMTLEDVKAVVEEPQTLLFPAMCIQASVMYRMEMIFMEATCGRAFITSDNPVTWVDPTACERSPGARFFGIGSPSVEVIMPVSPDLAVLFVHQNDLTGYIKIEATVVEEINRRVRHYAGEEFVASTSARETHWFD